MSFPEGPTRVGIDTAGDMSGGAWNADGTAKIEWATLLNSIIDDGVVNTNVSVQVNTVYLQGVSALNGTIPITIVAPTAAVDGAITESDLLAHRFAASSTPCGARIRVVADAGNDVSGVLIGNSSTPHFPLYAGLSIDLACSDLHNIYYQFQHSGDKIYYISTA
jgi:hypothetical protein